MIPTFIFWRKIEFYWGKNRGKYTKYFQWWYRNKIVYLLLLDYRLYLYSPRKQFSNTLLLLILFSQFPIFLHYIVLSHCITDFICRGQNHISNISAPSLLLTRNFRVFPEICVLPGGRVFHRASCLEVQDRLVGRSEGDLG